MRNGNNERAKNQTNVRTGSYPTYEEWKPWYRWLSEGEKAKVLILPMRNGNSSNVTKNFFIIPSSCSYPTYEEWKPTWQLVHEILNELFLSYL